MSPTQPPDQHNLLYQLLTNPATMGAGTAVLMVFVLMQWVISPMLDRVDRLSQRQDEALTGMRTALESNTAAMRAQAEATSELRRALEARGAVRGR